MLNAAPIRAYIPALDVSRARKFYEQTVALTPKEGYAVGVISERGGAEVFMYPTRHAGMSRASQAYWQVADVEAEVAELKARGVVFEEYDMRDHDAEQHRVGRRRQDGLVQGYRGKHSGDQPARLIVRT